jgi:hypothetical protein
VGQPTSRVGFSGRRLAKGRVFRNSFFAATTPCQWQMLCPQK